MASASFSTSENSVPRFALFGTSSRGGSAGIGTADSAAPAFFGNVDPRAVRPTVAINSRREEDDAVGFDIGETTWNDDTMVFVHTQGIAHPPPPEPTQMIEDDAGLPCPAARSLTSSEAAGQNCFSERGRPNICTHG